MLPSSVLRIAGILLAFGVSACPPPDVSAASVPSDAKPMVLDNTHRIDANAIDMFVTNHGSFAWDITSGNAGLIFPKGSGQTAVFAAGLWLGARVNGSTRVAVGEYSQEYAPGPMVGGSFAMDRPEFRTYRIVQGDSTSADYLSWKSGSAHLQGAPLDATGRPLLLGDQTLWSVCNDANPALHTNAAGSTAPLGVEAQLLTYAYSASEALDHAVFLRWTLTNKGANTLDSAYVSMWMDADVGGAGDDLAGCAVADDLGFMYNGDASDIVYGATPPAVGVDVLQGPIGAGGDRLGMTSFVRFFNGIDPANATQTYNYMRGLNADGTPIIDPTTSQVTTFMVSGDPVAGTGWIDTVPMDKRMMISTGPFTLAPGNQQEVVVAVVLAQSMDYLSAITQMKTYDQAVKDFFAGDSVTSVDPEPSRITPAPLGLSAPSIATAGSTVRVTVHLPEAATPTMRLYDPTGACRWSRSYGSMPAGDHGLTAPLDGLRAGLYILEASAGERRAARRIVLLP